MPPFKFTFKDDSINRMVYGTEPPSICVDGIEDAECVESDELEEVIAYSPKETPCK